MPVTSASIKKKAAELGFQSAGIVAADSLDAESRHLHQWLDQGFHASMAWMASNIEKRSDPRVLFPNARSVIVTTTNYFTPHEHSDIGGKISRYAWGDDYHDIVKDKLKALLAWITEQSPETNGKICVDTVPFMDKAWAARAGLGWIGKHSNLITRDVGSWVFIGSIIVDTELDYENSIIDDHCGTCTACLDACPTAAIVQPYVVDSAKCISHATIELRDDNIPADIAENLNGWIYGCDICQDVCPWNRFEEPTPEARFEPRNGETSLDIEKIASLKHNDYVNRFRRSAIKRTKLTGLKRNALALTKD